MEMHFKRKQLEIGTKDGKKRENLTQRLWLVHEEKIKERGVKFRTKSINSQAAGVHISLSFPCVMFTRTLVYFL